MDNVNPTGKHGQTFFPTHLVKFKRVSRHRPVIDANHVKASSMIADCAPAGTAKKVK